MRSGKLNLFLLMGILMTSGVWFFLERESERMVGQGETRTLLGYTEDRVMEVEWVSSDFRLVLQKQPTGWTMDFPVRDWASDARVKEWLHGLARQELYRPDIDAIGADDSRLGLDPPLIQMTVGDGVERTKVDFGRPTALGKGTYVRFPPKDAVWVLRSSMEDLSPDVLQLRNRELFPFPIEDVQRIELRGASGTMQVKRDTGRTWSLLYPIAARASERVVEDWLEELLAQRIGFFVAENVSDTGVYGLIDNSPEIRLYQEGAAEPVTLVLGDSLSSATGLVYAAVRSRDAVFAVPAALLDLADWSAEELRDRRPVPINRKDLQKVSIEYPGELLSLERNPRGQWDLIRSDRFAADEAKVDSLLKIWTAPIVLRFDDERKGRPPDLEGEKSPEVVLHFVGLDEEGVSREWSISLPEKASGEVVLAWMEPDLQWVELPSVLFQQALFNPLSFYGKKIFQFDPALVSGWQWESGSGTQRVQRSDSPEAAAAVQRQAEWMVGLESIGVVDERTELLPSEYFQEPVDRVTVLMEGPGGGSLTVILGNLTTEGHRLARALGAPQIFLLRQEDAERLMKPLQGSP